jgi:hypothetical protein
MKWFVIPMLVIANYYMFQISIPDAIFFLWIQFWCLVAGVVMGIIQHVCELISSYTAVNRKRVEAMTQWQQDQLK